MVINTGTVVITHFLLFTVSDVKRSSRTQTFIVTYLCLARIQHQRHKWEPVPSYHLTQANGTTGNTAEVRKGHHCFKVLLHLVSTDLPVTFQYEWGHSLVRGGRCWGLCYLSLPVLHGAYPPTHTHTLSLIWGKCLDFTNSWSHLKFFMELMEYFLWRIIAKLRSNQKRKLFGLHHCFSTTFFIIISLLPDILPLEPINLQTKLNSTDTMNIYLASPGLFTSVYENPYSMD